MLPTVEIDIPRVCTAAFDVNHGRAAILGYCFAYFANKVIGHANERHMSIDRLFTESLLEGMTAHPVKSSVLFWYSATSDLLFLTASDIRQQLSPMWMRQISGYMECGRDFVHPTAKPFAFWDGHNFMRVYPPPEDFHPGRTYLCDLGSLMGYYVGEGDPGAVDSVQAADPNFAFYSVLPQESQEVVTVGKRKCVLLHSFYSLKLGRSPKQQEFEDEYAD